MKDDNLIKDYKWLIAVINSCNTMQQVDGAINCYMLWSKKYSTIKDTHDIVFVSKLGKEIRCKLTEKINKLT